MAGATVTPAVETPAASDFGVEFTPDDDIIMDGGSVAPEPIPEPSQTPPVETPAPLTPAPSPVAETPTPAPVTAPEEFYLTDAELPAVAPAVPDPQALATKIAELEAQLQQVRNQPAPAPAAPVVEPEEAFCTEEEYEAALGDTKAFNALLGKVKTKTQQETVQAIQQTLVPQMLQAAARVAMEAVTTTNLVREFYVQNPDLDGGNRPLCGKVFNVLMAKHPDWDQGRLMQATAQETRRALKKAGVVVPAQQQAGAPVGPGASPAFAPPTGARPAAPSRRQLDPLAAEMSAIKL